MPKYIDHHPMPGPMPEEMVATIAASIKAGDTDDFGVKGVNAFTSDNEMWCVTETDGPEAIHKSHEAKGITLGAGDVTEVRSFV